MKIHIVQKGDTLWKIAKKYGVNFEELKQLNNQLSNPDMIMPGMKIKVPTSGGTIKKEAPISGNPETKINMGVKKEMPIQDHPFSKEKPKEAPIQVAPIKEAPIAPVAETPKPTYTPKMPQPIVPEIDIHNYYMMNMANVNLAPQPKPVAEPIKPKPVAKAEIKPAPQLPPKPVTKAEIKPAPQLPPKPIANVEMKPVAMPTPKQVNPLNMTQEQPLAQEQPAQQVKPIKPLPIVSPMEQPEHQGECYQPMYPTNPQGFNPYQQQPMFGAQNPYQQAQGFPQVQGAMTGMPMMPQMGMQHYDDESSSFMPQMPSQMAGMPGQVMGMQSPMAGQGQVMGMQSPMANMPNMPNFPNQVMGMEDAQMPMMPNMPNMPSEVMGVEDAQMPLMPTQVAGVQEMPMYQPAYPYPPYCAPLFPGGPMMPGPGFIPQTMPMMQQPYMPMPQVQGVMDQAQPMPMANMPHANMPLEPMPQVQGMQEDCGCGGPMMAPTPYAMPGMPPVYAPAQNFAQPPFMNPYGYGPTGMGGARGQNYDRNQG